jgi:hypothetical protein
MPSNNIISWTLARVSSKHPTGKKFFVSDVSGACWNDLGLTYPPDADGITRVHTTVTLALAQCVTGRGDAIILAPDFTTALTATEVISAETKGVSIYPAGNQTEEGCFVVTRATANLPQTATQTLFTIVGRVRIKSMTGEVTTPVQDQALTGQLYIGDVVTKSSTSFTAATSLRNNPSSTFWSVTGTLANAMSSGKFAAVYEAASIVVGGGNPGGTSKIQLTTSASSTGKMKWRIEYIPLEAGSRVIAA